MAADWFFSILPVLFFVTNLRAELRISWFPKSDNLVYSLSDELIVFDVNTLESLYIGKGSNPIWSPVSDQIVFFIPNDWPDSSGPVFVIDSDGTNRRMVYETGGPAHWSPDGKRIAFSLTREAECYDGGNQYEFLVVIQDVDGENRRQHSLLCDYMTTGLRAWWPIGITYQYFLGAGMETAEKVSALFDVESGEQYWVPNTASFSLTTGNLAFFSLGDDASYQNDTSWLESGTYITDGSAGFEQIEAGVRQGTVFKVTDLIGQGSPSWSPDGRQLAIDPWMEREDVRHIYIVDVNSTELGRLTDHSGWEFHPSWSHDGEKIACFRSDETSDDSLPVLTVANVVANTGGESQGWGSLKKRSW